MSHSTEVARFPESISEAREPRARADLTLGKKIALSLVPLVALLLALELGARLFSAAIGRGPADTSEFWYEPDEQLLYRLRPGFSGKVSDYFGTSGRVNNLGLRGRDLSAAKKSGTLRVLTLGDSRTFGLEVNQGEEYPAQLEGLFRGRGAGKRVEIVNAGTIGYTSYQGMRLLEMRMEELKPDLVTFAFGYNDRRFVLTREQADGARWFAQVARGLRWRERMNFSYALLGLAEVFRRTSGTASWKDKVTQLPSHRLDDLACRVDEDPFRKNISRIIEICRERGVPVMMLIMGDTARAEEPFLLGQKLRAQGKYEEAFAAFDAYDDNLPDASLAGYFRALYYYETGLTFEKQGKADEAARLYLASAQAAAQSSVFGGALIRHVRDYIGIMHEVADRYQIPRVDIEARFRDRPEMYPDHCHFSPEAHRLIAQLVFKAIEENQLLERNRRPGAETAVQSGN